MKSSDDPVPVRKAFSAENAKEDSSELPYDSGFKTPKSCASASYVTARGKYVQDNHLQNLIPEDFSSHYFKLDAKDDQKLFLSASQILEKLSKIIIKYSDIFQHNETAEIPSASSGKISFREIVVYQEVLKRLLEERCILVLKDDCDICIKRTIQLINDFKHLYVNEKLKMMTMPIQACNRFINSDDIKVSTLELLIKKLQIICDLHLSISSSYQKIINCFYVSLDLELYQIVLKTNRLLYKYKSSLFHWGYKCMTILMQKLCLADPISVSPDFLQSILASCEIFNTLIKNNKELKHCFSKRYDLFYKHAKHTECKEVPFSLVLNYLAYFEAKIASERIVHFLTSTCKKNRQISIKKKNLSNNGKSLKSNHSTSDYHSASISDIESEKSTVKITEFTNANINFSNLLVSITQRNQSLILKYIYAIANLSNSSSRIKRRPSCESNSSITSVRQMWNVPEQNFQSNNYILLEESFWLKFWSNIHLFVLKILYEVPYHQYGDSIGGTIFLWPDAYVDSFIECLKSSIINNDITDDGKYTLKQIYEYIFMNKIHALWDKEFLSTIISYFSHHSTLVPSSLNQIKTLPGSLFQACIDVLLKIFDVDFQNMDLLLFLQCLHQIHSTLDFFILWTNNRIRAAFASRNLSTYLIVCWSDCKDAVKLLQTKTAVLVKNTDSFTRIPALRLQKEKIIWNQIDILTGCISEVPNLVCNFCFSAIRNDFLLPVNEHSRNKCFCFGQNILKLEALEELMYSLTEVVNISDHLPVLTAISTSVAQAFIFILHHKKKTMSVELIRFIEYELAKFREWLDKRDSAQDEKLKLKNLVCLRKVEAILKYIQIPTSRSSIFSMRLNRVMPVTDTGIQLNDDVLTDVEKQYWQSVNSRLCCF
ncbi:uncharacterized protein LOC129963192 isoform X2 [Argiope bruennichi]|uniref:Coiled-coil protein 142 C-terminal domain-containing protein n=1 Tax=Argiope bruennichi TaxID=94029 RepID=A0A8T0EYE9_ARGBR|nr:uncharacterized protein LOC129963192 isoform X2 [Argiope bruennichi]KAF8783393.1 hypothetical protein HNY73_013558 [Argiope bruennichi]